VVFEWFGFEFEPQRRFGSVWFGAVENRDRTEPNRTFKTAQNFIILIMQHDHFLEYSGYLGDKCIGNALADYKHVTRSARRFRARKLDGAW
jgi:hypothetical protein